VEFEMMGFEMMGVGVWGRVVMKMVRRIGGGERRLRISTLL
jgi:hypothetical protein